MTIVPREEQQSGLLPANTIQRSLIIRLLVRRPLRSRNVREMKLAENLFQENGKWIIEFQGEQMKVAKRGDRLNIFRVTFPGDLVPLLEEFLETWRPILNVNDLSKVFVTKTGRPFTAHALNQAVRKTVYAYTGRPTNIHLFRDIWATEFIIATQDFITAARMLNDDVQTVLAYYAHLRSQDASNTADEFLATTLGNVREKEDTCSAEIP